MALELYQIWNETQAFFPSMEPGSEIILPVIAKHFVFLSQATLNVDSLY